MNWIAVISISYLESRWEYSEVRAVRFILVLVCAALISISLPANMVSGAPGRMVRDQAGRSVAVPDNLQRIVTLAPSITELIYTLGEQHKLAGVAQQSDYPAEAKSIPTIGTYIRPDIEKIVALKPDLCFATRSGNPPDIAGRLESLGIPVYVINPLDLEGIMRCLGEMGELLGAGRKAREAVENVRVRIDRVKALVARTSSRPKVFFQIGTAPLVSVGRGTFADELIRLAGGQNISENRGLYPRFTTEQVLVLKPDVIIITSMTRGENFDRVRSEWNQWPSLPAVRNGRVFIVDSDIFDRPTVRLVDALEELVHLVHPELFRTAGIRGT